MRTRSESVSSLRLAIGRARNLIPSTANAEVDSFRLPYWWRLRGNLRPNAPDRTNANGGCCALDSATTHPEWLARYFPHEFPDHGPVIEYTRQIFGQQPTVALDIDPETNAQSFLVTAPATGSVDELVALDHKWHCGLREALGNLADQYRLSIDPQ